LLLGVCLFVACSDTLGPPGSASEVSKEPTQTKEKVFSEKVPLPEKSPNKEVVQEPEASPEPSVNETTDAGFENTLEPIPERVPEVVPEKPGYQSPYWWQDAVVYQIMLRSFQDSDGDGIGDIKGLIKRLDYLNDGDPKTTDDLGVNAIWLLPIFSAKSAHGYDTLDYKKVQAEYGSLQDFKTLIKEAHRRGIRIILDMVFNHTSDEHPWFKESKKNTSSTKRDWYVWRKSNPKWPQPWGGGTSWHPFGPFFYYGVFWKGMPDLNLRHIPVRREVAHISRYWLSLGVDGFRFDAARYMIEGDAAHKQGDQPETHAFWKEYRNNVKSVSKQVMLVGEIWTDIHKITPYCKGDEFDLAFHFPLADAIYHSITQRQSSILWRALEASYKMPFTCWAPFLSNHDTTRIFTRFQQNATDMRSAAWLLLTIPGTPFIYYGEELGTLQGTLHKGYDTRMPMAWTKDTKGGFTTGTPWHPLPKHDKANVAGQTKDANSFLSLYRKLIRVRLQYPALRVGTFLPLIMDGQGVASVVAFIRIHKEQRLAVLVNVGKKPVKNIKLLFSIDVAKIKPVLTEGKVVFRPPLASSPKTHFADLEAGGAAVFELLKNP